MITNVRNHEVLAHEQRKAEGWTSMLFGLMFTKENPDLGLIFPFDQDWACPIHTWFVFYPIDIIYLDKEMKVIDMKKNIKPFTKYHPKVAARTMIEFVAGTLERTHTDIGDQIHWF